MDVVTSRMCKPNPYVQVRLYMSAVNGVKTSLPKIARDSSSLWARRDLGQGQDAVDDGPQPARRQQVNQRRKAGP